MVQPGPLGFGIDDGETLPAADLGKPYSYQVAVDGGHEPYTFDADGLPAGLDIDEDGRISGSNRPLQQPPRMTPAPPQTPDSTPAGWRWGAVITTGRRRIGRGGAVAKVEPMSENTKAAIAEFLEAVRPGELLKPRYTDPAQIGWLMGPWEELVMRAGKVIVITDPQDLQDDLRVKKAHAKRAARRNGSYVLLVVPVGREYVRVGGLDAAYAWQVNNRVGLQAVRWLRKVLELGIPEGYGDRTHQRRSVQTGRLFAALAQIDPTLERIRQRGRILRVRQLHNETDLQVGERRKHRVHDSRIDHDHGTIRQLRRRHAPDGAPNHPFQQSTKHPPLGGGCFCFGLDHPHVFPVGEVSVHNPSAQHVPVGELREPPSRGVTRPLEGGDRRVDHPVRLVEGHLT